MEISKLVDLQRNYYFTNETLDFSFRKHNLKKLRAAIIANEANLKAALLEDLGKNASESYFAEIGIALSELTYMEKHLKKLMKKKKVGTSLRDFPAKSFRSPHPYGVVLIMSPWNYPVMLTLCPLIGALGAGNTCILKPSDYSPNTSKVLAKMIQDTFSDKYVSVVTGGRKENQTLLDQKFDYIFFTGGKVVGRIVMEKAAKNLTPISLELGGKSPCIVDETASLKTAAKRIVFGKYLNAGQTCVAPDYLFVQETVKKEFLEYFQEAVKKTFGEYPLKSEYLGKIINQKHYDRLSNLLSNQKIIIGGKKDDNSLKIEPTVIDDVKPENVIMEDEIFGPILPVLTYQKLEDVITYVNSRPNPLALYLFTNNKGTQKNVLKHCNFGGGCINDTVMHVASETLPFGGVGESGMGSYHGRFSFETFSHYRSILKKANWLDLPVRYAPYTKSKNRILRKFLR